MRSETEANGSETNQHKRKGKKEEGKIEKQNKVMGCL
jgi:hypothetical protein